MDDFCGFLTISDVLEYLYCPRFIYFMHCLNIDQYEGKRFKVQKGRDIHEKKRVENPSYLRKKIGVVSRMQEVYLSSNNLHIRGIIDDVLTLNDGTMAPFEYKYSEYKKNVPETYRTQLLFHAFLIMEYYNVDVNKGFICFVRSNNHIEEISIRREELDELIEIVKDILAIIKKGYYPDKSRNSNRCNDCTYRKICV